MRVPAEVDERDGRNRKQKEEDVERGNVRRQRVDKMEGDDESEDGYRGKRQ